MDGGELKAASIVVWATTKTNMKTRKAKNKKRKY